MFIIFVSLFLMQTLLALKDHSMKSIVKKTRSFVVDNVNYELDSYEQPVTGIILLEAYVSSSQELAVPSYLEVVKEVTNDPAFCKTTFAKQ